LEILRGQPDCRVYFEMSIWLPSTVVTYIRFKQDDCVQLLVRGMVPFSAFQESDQKDPGIV